MKSILFVFLSFFVACSSFVAEPPAKPKPKIKKLQPPLRFLIIGDSMAGGWFGILLEEKLQQLPGFSAHRRYKISTGLSGLHRFDWYKEGRQLQQKHSPDILVVFFGANDGLAVRRRGKKWRKRYPKTFYYARKQKYKELYSMYVYEFMLENYKKYKKIFWLGQPATDHKELSYKYPLINEIYRREAEKFSNIHYIPSWKLTSNEKGKFLKYMQYKNGKKKRVKGSDSVHHTKAGGEIFLDLVWQYIRQEIEIPQKKTTVSFPKKTNEIYKE